MSILRRYPADAHAFFVTVVSHDRRDEFIDCVDLLYQACKKVILMDRCRVVAWVVMPDHIHAIIVPSNGDISAPLFRFKMIVGANWRKRRGLYSGRLWQHRFWDHIIRNDIDMTNHLNYIHYNPVRHGLVTKPQDWQWSSIHRFFHKGMVEPDWLSASELDVRSFGDECR